MMRVVLHRDAFYSINNTRLCLYRLCEHIGLITQEIPIKVILLSQLPPGFFQKFTTPCQGDWVTIRNDGRICARSWDDTTFGREELFGPAAAAAPRLG